MVSLLRIFYLVLVLKNVRLLSRPVQAVIRTRMKALVVLVFLLVSYRAIVRDRRVRCRRMQSIVDLDIHVG